MSTLHSESASTTRATARLKNRAGNETRSEARTVALWSSGLFAITALAMTLRDLPVLYLPGDTVPYLLGRGLVLSLVLFYFLSAYFHRTVRDFELHLYVVTMAYCLHGEYFQPNYWLAFIQLNALFIAFFSINRALLPWLYGGSLLAFASVLAWRAPVHVQHGGLTPQLVGDVMVGLVITQVIGTTLYFMLLGLRSEKSRLNHRFTDLGRNFSFALHDLKGMISSQVVYARLLRGLSTNETLPRQEKEALTYLTEDIQLLQHFVEQINRLIRSELSDEIEQTRVSQSFERVKVLFRSKLRNIELRLVGDLELRTQPYVVNRILINAITNSIDEIHRNAVEKGEITITCGGQQILIQDNSGTHLDPRTLRSLNQPLLSMTSKADGSGLGTFIIKEYVHMIGGKVWFSNETAGVMVKIQLPKRIIARNA